MRIMKNHVQLLTDNIEIFSSKDYPYDLNTHTDNILHELNFDITNSFSIG